LAFVVAVVTFPQLARHTVAGRYDQARRQIAVDIQIVSVVVLAATAYLIGFAPQVVEVLLQRGAFTPADTAASAALLRFYAWGLLGQAVLGIVCRALFSERATFFPAIAVAVGVLLTAVIAGLGGRVWGAPAIAAADAVGITVTTAVVVCAPRSSAIPARTVGLVIARLLPATALATLCALGLAAQLRDLPAMASAVVGAFAVLVVFTAAAALARGIPMPRVLPGFRRRAKERKRGSQ
jgi:putative peptidoglycan lipid II flippase